MFSKLVAPWSRIALSAMFVCNAANPRPNKERTYPQVWSEPLSACASPKPKHATETIMPTAAA